jgi:hypothetical protein
MGKHLLRVIKMKAIVLLELSVAFCLSLSLAGVDRAAAQTAPPPALVKAAEAGDPNMEWALGHFYLTSTSNSTQAYAWLKKAADAGQQNAQIELKANFPASGPTAPPQQTGIAQRANEAKALLLANAPDMQLTMFRLDMGSPAQYVFYSHMHQQQVTILDVAGKLVVTDPVPVATRFALPGNFIDLPQAMASASAQGMQGDITSAFLTVSQAQGKPPVAVWTLTPSNSTRFLSYFVSATDARPLALADFSDGVGGTDAQLHAAWAAQHPAPQVQGGGGYVAGGSTSGPRFDANAAYRQSQMRAYNYKIFQNDPARAQNCRDHGC